MHKLLPIAALAVTTLAYAGELPPAAPQKPVVQPIVRSTASGKPIETTITPKLGFVEKILPHARSHTIFGGATVSSETTAVDALYLAGDFTLGIGHTRIRCKHDHQKSVRSTNPAFLGLETRVGYRQSIGARYTLTPFFGLGSAFGLYDLRRAEMHTTTFAASTGLKASARCSDSVRLGLNAVLRKCLGYYESSALGGYRGSSSGVGLAFYAPIRYTPQASPHCTIAFTPIMATPEVGKIGFKPSLECDCSYKF